VHQALLLPFLTMCVHLALQLLLQVCVVLCAVEAVGVACLQDYIGTLPAVDRAEAFGQHPNADIAYQIEDSWLVLESLLSLQPQTALAAGAKSREDTVAAICADLLDQVHVPGHICAQDTPHAGLLRRHGYNV